MTGNTILSGWRVALSDAALLGVVAYIGLTAWRHSDAELINPETSIPVSKVFGIESVPTGRIIAPLLDIEVSIFTFYLVAPVAVLVAHAVLVMAPSRDPSLRFAFSRSLSLFLPPVVLLLLLWKFAPYMHARPADLTTSAGPWLTRLHTMLVAVDMAVIAFGLLSAVENELRVADSRRSSKSRPVRIVVAIKLVALCSLPAVIAAWMLEGWLDGEPAWSTVLLAMAAAMLGLVAAAVAAVMLGRTLARWPSVIERITAGIILAEDPEEGLKRGSTVIMQIILAVALMLLPALLWAEVPRPLDLAGARLFAREPSEGLLAAVIAATARPEEASKRSDEPARSEAQLLSDAQVLAWEAFGDGIDLSWWRFAGVSFQGASLQRIGFSNTDLRGANLIRANLAGADLTSAKLGGATLTQADLRGAGLRDGGALLVQLVADPPGSPPAIPIDLSDANLAGANLSGAKLQGANLSRANLTNATMSPDTKLSGANLTSANLSGAKLQGADLSGANLTNATISSDTNLETADLRRAILHNVTLSSKHLKETKIAGANFCGANLAGVDLSQADWVTSDAGTTKPSFKNANLEDVTLPRALANIVLVGANIRGVRFAQPKLGDGVGDLAVKVDLTSAKLMNVKAIDVYHATCESR